MSRSAKINTQIILSISHKNISNWRERKKIKHLKITLTKSQDFQNRSLTDCHRNAQWSVFTKQRQQPDQTASESAVSVRVPFVTPEKRLVELRYSILI